jgi:hypothetical protein
MLCVTMSSLITMSFENSKEMKDNQFLFYCVQVITIITSIGETFFMPLGANGIQWANMITEKNYMSFFPKETFSYEWILEQVLFNLL